MTTGLFLLRCSQMGLSMEDLEGLTVGAVYDMFTERGNDEIEWPEVAGQEDFDRF